MCIRFIVAEGTGNLSKYNKTHAQGVNIMSNLEFFKKQAKNLLKDWQTQTKTVATDGFISYHYDWKFYDVGDLFFYYEFSDEDEQEIILARAQHLIAQMVGFKKWDELIHATDIELELAELLLRRFKNSSDIQDWEETLVFTGVGEYGTEVVLDYAKQYFQLGDSRKIVELPIEKVTILSGKLKSSEINKFDDAHNPEGTLRKDSDVYCMRCRKSFRFNRSKVIRDNEKGLTMVVCKNYPDCRGTYLDYKVLTPTIMYGNVKTAELNRSLAAFQNLCMNTKVRCLHCDQEYQFNEAKVVLFPEYEEPMIMCKNYPECNGRVFDMISQDKVSQ